MKTRCFKRGLAALLCALMLLTAAGCAAQGGGTAVVIDGGWLIRSDAADAGESGGWSKGYGEKDADGDESAPVVWYCRSFDSALKAGAGERLTLSFSDTGYFVKVWLNGKAVGEHTGSYGEFTLDVTDAAKSGKNTLVVRAVTGEGDYALDGMSAEEAPAAPAGMALRAPVYLAVRPDVIVAQTSVCTDSATGKAEVTVTLDNASGKEAKVTLTGELSAVDTRRVMATDASEVTAPEGLSTHTLSVTLDDFTAWSFENPYLYRFTVSAQAEGAKYADTGAVNTGFKNITLDTHGYFSLNGECFWLKAADIPAGICADSAAVRRFVDFIRTCEFNAVRVTGGSATAALLDYCDKTGILVVDGTGYGASAAGASDELARLAARAGAHVSLALAVLPEDAADAVSAWRGTDKAVLLLCGTPDAKGGALKASLPFTDGFDAAVGGKTPGLYVACAVAPEEGDPAHDGIDEWYEAQGLDKQYASAATAYAALLNARAEKAAVSLAALRAGGESAGFCCAFDIASYPDAFMEIFNDALDDLRWIITTDADAYAPNAPIHITVSLSNFDVLALRGYTALIKVTGSDGVVFTKTVDFACEDEGEGHGQRLIAVLDETLPEGLAAGEYTVAAELTAGAHPTCGEKAIIVSAELG